VCAGERTKSTPFHAVATTNGQLNNADKKPDLMKILQKQQASGAQ
jgi:hypothetical protein